MALYGSVPLLLNLHNKISRPTFSGFLWLNPSESWIRLNRNPGEPSETGHPKSAESSARVRTSSTFISETGTIDFAMFAGPTASAVLSQYHFASGFPAPAPLFAMAKHQCRWNYNDEADIAAVEKGFDDHEIPMDVLWLDIEHTDGKKYFTWHPQHFPTPEQMITKLAKNGRKLVAIVDPHIKKEAGYPVYDTLLSQNAVIRNSNADGTPGEAFEGWCWPGTSVYPDFIDSRVRPICVPIHIVHQ